MTLDRLTHIVMGIPNVDRTDLAGSMTGAHAPDQG